MKYKTRATIRETAAAPAGRSSSRAERLAFMSFAIKDGRLRCCEAKQRNNVDHHRIYVFFVLFSVVRKWSRFWPCSNVCLCLCLGALLHSMDTLAGFCCVSINFSVLVRFPFGGASTCVLDARACICRAFARVRHQEKKKLDDWMCTRMNTVSRTASTGRPSVHDTRNQYRNGQTHTHTQTRTAWIIYSDAPKRYS